MAKVFGILTAIVLALALFVGFKNKNAYQTELDNHGAAKTSLANNQDKLAKNTASLESTRKSIDETKAQIPEVKARGAAQVKANDALTASKTTKTQEVDANKAKLDQVREQTERLGNVKELAAKMSTMSNEMSDLDVAIQGSESKLATLTSESGRLDAIVAEQQKQEGLRSKGESFATLNTRVSAVYPNWGFVTLAAGNTSGVITNSTLDVVRDDEVIAKLLVTAVERNTASASIVPESVKADTTVSAGDRVVPGIKPATTAPTSAAAPAVKPAGN